MLTLSGEGSQHIILLDSVEAAVKMLDNKSARFSGRPILPLMAGDLLGCKGGLSLLQYGDRFRETRKQFHQVTGTRKAIKAYYVEIHKFLKRVLVDLERFGARIRT